MSELDYQRGLRGGDCRVTASEDYDRWKDWNDGHDEYERRLNEEDERRYTQLLSPKELESYYEQKRREHAIERAHEESENKRYWRESKAKAYEELDKNLPNLILLYGFLFALCLIAAFILQWILSLFDVNFSTSVIWIIGIITLFIFGYYINAEQNEKTKEVEQKYGKRD